MKTVLLNFFILVGITVFQYGFHNALLPNQQQYINTVAGKIYSSDIGFALTHEHIMSNFGKELDSSFYYNEDELFRQTIPYLKYIKSLGVKTIMDCTTEYFGRRVDLLKKISDSTGIQIITNTGIYGAANDKYVPEFAYKVDADSISKIWIDEFNNGINSTSIKPGFIKLAFDNGIPSEIDKKLFEAGILAHLETGLPLVVHTGDNMQAVNFQLELLKKYGVNESSWIWVHANKVTDDDVLIRIASQGAWISLDGINSKNYLQYAERIKKFKSENLLHKILLSHDGNAYRSGREIKHFNAIIKDLIPALLSDGFTQEEVNKIMVANPKNAFEIKE